MISKLYKSISCILIWMQVLSCTGFAGTEKTALPKEHLSPRISINKYSMQTAIRVYSKAKVEEALFRTAKNINDIGQIHLKRNLKPREILVALAMVLEGKNLRYIKEFGIKKDPREISIMLRFASVLFFLLSFAAGFAESMFILPAFLFFGWYSIGWAVHFFSWIEKKIHPANKYVFDDPVEDLNAKEKKEFLAKIDQVMRNIIKIRFDHPDKAVKSDSALMILELGQPLCPMTGSINSANGIFAAI